MLTILETPMLTLREVTLDDAPAIQAYTAQESQWRQQAMEPAEFLDSRKRIERYRDHRGPDDARRLFAYVAHEKSTGTLVGQASLSRMMHPKIASVGFGVAEAQAGKGFATEVAARMLAFAFNDIGINRVTAEIAVENVASQRIAEKIGMRREGVARDCIFAQGRWWTEAIYAKLARDRQQ